jgi:DNA (cytosine-5)-methyltransferase 3A
MINAALVSAQSRKRLFWTNLQFELPVDRKIILADILQEGGVVDDRMVNKEKKSYCLTASYWGATEKNSVERKQRTMVGCRLMGHFNGSESQFNRFYSKDGKSPTLSAIATTHIGLVEGEKIKIRKLTPVECERLQGLPDNYTDGISRQARYKCLGNAFNVDVVAHILKKIPEQVPTKPESPPSDASPSHPIHSSTSEPPANASPSSSGVDTTAVKPKRNTQNKKSNRNPVSSG